MSEKIEKIFNDQTSVRNNLASAKPDADYLRKLRRRVEDRIRKDEEALTLVARVLNIK